MTARCTAWRTSCRRVAPRASLLSMANTTEMPHHEHEGGKHEVGGGQAIPGGVVHEAPRAAPAVVVDHDHERDRDPARDVQRQ